MDIANILTGVSVGLGALSLVGLFNWRKYKKELREVEELRAWEQRTVTRQHEELEYLRKLEADRIQQEIQAAKASQAAKPKRKYTRRAKPEQGTPTVEAGAPKQQEEANLTPTSPLPNGEYSTERRVDSAWPFPTDASQES